MREGCRKLAATKQQLTLIKIDRFHSLFSCFILVNQGVSIPRHCYNTILTWVQTMNANQNPQSSHVAPTTRTNTPPTANQAPPGARNPNQQ